MRIAIVVTHLLGTGHLVRAMTLARAFAHKGHAVHVISGGTPLANLDRGKVALHQLTPVKSDGVNFTILLGVDGQPIGQEALAQRSKMACNLIRKIAPDVLICELYPFGRRVLKTEFLSILQTARALDNQPVILCSIREILAPPSRPEKALETEAVLTRYFNAVLVHSDPLHTPLETSWPVTPPVAKLLAYTGYVAPPLPAPHPEGYGQGEVLVTAGGGDVGMGLFQTAVIAAQHDKHRHWRLLVGGASAAKNIARLQSLSNGHKITIEKTRPDFRQMLPNAAAAVAMCGYNTAMDLLQSGTPAVFVPFDAGGEQEQTLRAKSLSKAPQFACISSSDLTPKKLLTALDQVKRNPSRSLQQFNGAEESVRIAVQLAKDRK